MVILRRETSGGEEFFTLYGHLSKDSLARLAAGTRVARGQPFARVGSTQENGGWTPHVHFQIILDLLELDADFPGVAYASQRTVWTSVSPEVSSRSPTEQASLEVITTARICVGIVTRPDLRKSL